MNAHSYRTTGGIVTGLVLVLGLGIGLTAHARRVEAPNTATVDQIRTHKLDIVGKNDEVIASLRSDIDGTPLLTLISPKNKNAIVLRVDDTGEDIHMLDPEGNASLALSANNATGLNTVSIFGKPGAKMCSLEIDRDSVGLMVGDGKDAIASLLVKDGHTRFMLGDKEGTSVLASKAIHFKDAHDHKEIHKP